MDPLSHPTVTTEISRAWRDSQAGDPAVRHEEGGYILLNPDGSLRVERWARGERSRINPPPLGSDNRYNGGIVVAAFHTHPNPPVDEKGREWEQGPSDSDRRWHRRRGLGGFVVSRLLIHGIDAAGDVRVIGDHNKVLSR